MVAAPGERPSWLSPLDRLSQRRVAKRHQDRTPQDRRGTFAVYIDHVVPFALGWRTCCALRSKTSLIVGPVITAVGYLLFLLPGIGGKYWTNFFPPVVVLGLGMATTVAPLTTTVMSSLAQNRAGIASGVNNAVARTASLIAIAVLGVVMLHVFKTNLNRRLAEADLPSSVAQSVQAQSTRLAAIDLPQNLNVETQQLIRRAIDESFVTGFKSVMLIGACLAVASAMIALFWIAAASLQERRKRSKSASFSPQLFRSEQSLKDALRNFPPIIWTLACLQFLGK